MNLEINKISGLSSDEVKIRVKAGLFNDVSLTKTKTITQIIKGNLFSFFNILNLVFALIIIATGQFSNLAFLIVVVLNLIIGIVQEVSAKKTLDKLSFTNVLTVTAIREGKQATIPINEIVKDDVLLIKSGNQICVDGLILAGQCEVNESAISGESDLILKKEGDYLFSGSYQVSGSVYLKVTAVGSECFVGKVALDSSCISVPSSSLMHSINVILKIISMVIVPFGILVFLKGNFINGLSLDVNINSTIALLISMVPEGLVLMTSLALVSGSVILANKRILVQDLFAIENLARTDILCMDKTGTLTTGDMYVSSYCEISDIKNEICFAISVLGDSNSTFNAIKEFFVKNINSDFREYNDFWCVDFKSENKFSCVGIKDFGRIFIGAPDVLLSSSLYAKLIDDYNINIFGKRIIVIAFDGLFDDSEIRNHECLSVAAIITIDECIRNDAHNTIDFFRHQDISPVIVSGDSCNSLETVISELNISPVFFDFNTEYTNYNFLDYSVFCRCLPENKKHIIEEFQCSGNSVAMVGDGVNDVIDLIKANSSIAMGNGSDIARNISDIVLLDSDIGVLPAAFNQGRRVINNIQRVSALFITKTIYSFIIALLILFLPNLIYPFNALQLTFLSFITIGFPAFFLSFEPDYSKVKDAFLKTVLIKSLPGAFSIVVSFIFISILAYNIQVDANDLSTISFALFAIIGIFNACVISWPLTKLRLIVILASAGILILIFLIPFMRSILALSLISPELILFVVLICIVAVFVNFIIRKFSFKMVPLLLKPLKRITKKI